MEKIQQGDRCWTGPIRPEWQVEVDRMVAEMNRKIDTEVLYEILKENVK